MSVMLPPQKQVLVARHLNNPSDSGTYYCKASVYDAVSGDLLDSFPLDDDGGKYFSKLWRTPADPSGEGRQIIVSITCYDDPDYQDESPVYGTEKEMWVIQSRTQNLGGGGLDYNEVKSIMADIMAKMPKEEPDLSPFTEQVEALRSELKQAVKEQEDSASAIEERFDSVAAKLERMEGNVMRAEEVFGSLAQVADALSKEMSDAADAAISGIRDAADEAQAGLTDRVNAIADLAISGIRDEVSQGAQKVAHAVTEASESFLANPISLSLAPQGEVKAQVGRQQSKSVRPLQQLIA